MLYFYSKYSKGKPTDNDWHWNIFIHVNCSKIRWTYTIQCIDKFSVLQQNFLHQLRKCVLIHSVLTHRSFYANESYNSFRIMLVRNMFLIFLSTGVVEENYTLFFCACYPGASAWIKIYPYQQFIDCLIWSLIKQHSHFILQILCCKISARIWR